MIESVYDKTQTNFHKLYQTVHYVSYISYLLYVIANSKESLLNHLNQHDILSSFLLNLQMKIPFLDILLISFEIHMI